MFFDFDGNVIGKEEFVKIYSKLYTSEDKKMVQEILANDKFTPVYGKFEEIADAALNKEEPYITDELDQEEKRERIWKLIAWKAGRLEYLKEKDSQKEEPLFISKDGKYAWSGLNGMGSKIGKKRGEENLKESDRRQRIYDYIDKLCDDLDYQVMNSQSDECLPLFRTEKGSGKKGGSAFKSDYQYLLDCECANIGTVYMITLLFFFSKGKYPIYDKYAHIAAKAIYLNANPKDIYYAEAPSKTERQKVFAMYNEYCWLLEQIFGTKSIGRPTDQALWVYGHCKKKYDGETKSNESNNKDNKYKILDFLKDKEK